MNTNLSHDVKPYPHKCKLPVSEYPFAMRPQESNENWLENHIDLQKRGGNFVLQINVPSWPTQQPSLAAQTRIVQALIQDLFRWAALPRWGTSLLRAVELGGAASALHIETLQRLVDAIVENFQLAASYEMNLTGTPQNFSNEKIDYIVQSPINRVTLQVHSFQAELVADLNLAYSVEDTRHVLHAFQVRKFNNLALDLSYQLPGQSLAQWQRDLQIVASLKLAHCSLRAYSQTAGQNQLPDSLLAQSMYRSAQEILLAAAYSAYTADQFCQPGFASQFQHFATQAHTDTLGVGPASYSYVDGYRFGKESDLEKYIQHCQNGTCLIRTVSGQLSARAQAERYNVLALQYCEVEFAAFQQVFGKDFLDEFANEVARLERKRLIEVQQDRIRLTKLGFNWRHNVMLEFLPEQVWQDAQAALSGPQSDFTSARQYWLGEKEQIFFDNPHHSEIEEMANALAAKELQSLAVPG